MQFWISLWDKLNGELDVETADTVYRQAVGSLLFHRYIICCVTDPCGYGILEDHPEDELHKKLGAIAQVLGRLCYGVGFEAKQRYMKDFNNFISDQYPCIWRMCDNMREASFYKHSRSEHAKIGKPRYEQALAMYESVLEQSGRFQE